MRHDIDLALAEMSDIRELMDAGSLPEEATASAGGDVEGDDSDTALDGAEDGAWDGGESGEDEE